MTLRSLLLTMSLAACSTSAPPHAPSFWPTQIETRSTVDSQPPAATPAASPAASPVATERAFDAADARAFYEALVFSLQQVGQHEAAARLAESEVTTALTKAYPSAAIEIRNALDTAHETWAMVQARWSMMSLDERRELVHAVLVIGVGEQAANQLVGRAAPRGRRGGGGGAGAGDIVVDYEGSGCWASAGCAGYESDGGGGGTYTFEEPSMSME